MLGGGGGVTCDGLASHPGEEAELLFASCYRNRDINLKVLAQTLSSLLMSRMSSQSKQKLNSKRRN